MTKLFKLSILVFVYLLIQSCSSSKSIGMEKGGPLFTAPIAIQTYSFRNYFPKDVPGTLDRLKNMGITEIEGDGGRIPPAEFRKMCKERGITIPSTGAGFKQLEDDPLSIAVKAKALGSKYVMCAWVPHENSGNFSLDDAKKAVQVFNSAGKVLKEQGITFTYHAHGYEFQPYGDGTLMDYIIENTNPEYVGFEMDIFWVHFGGGDCVSLLKKYGDRWKLMHLKDMKKGIAKDLTGHTDVEYNVPLGTGELDMVNILKEGKKIGIAHYFIEDESSVVVTQVPKSIAYLRSLKM